MSTLAQEKLCCAELSLSGILWDLFPVPIMSGSANQCDSLDCSMPERSRMSGAF